MKKIMSATLNRTSTYCPANPNYGEYEWIESIEMEHGESWNGNVRGFVENLDLPDGYHIIEDYDGAIRDLPDGAIIVANEDGNPCEIYWAVEQKYLVFHESEVCCIDEFSGCFDTPEEANAHAECEWRHLTEREKSDRHIYVGTVTKEDLLEEAFEFDEIDWSAYRNLRQEDGLFDSENIFEE